VYVLPRETGTKKLTRGAARCIEQLLRALPVKWMEGLSFRDTIVRIADSTVLRNFTRSKAGTMATVISTGYRTLKERQ